jgi:hypothetical protein
MCDYSLHGVAARPAKIGDKWVTTHFWNTTTRGFSAVGEPRVAVCLLPGTEVVLSARSSGISPDFSSFSDEPPRYVIRWLDSGK